MKKQSQAILLLFAVILTLFSTSAQIPEPDNQTDSVSISETDSISTSGVSLHSDSVPVETISKEPVTSVDSTYQSRVHPMGDSHLTDTLSDVDHQRSLQHSHHNPQSKMSKQLTTSSIFSSDATGSSEFLKNTPVYIQVPFGLSNNFNRILPYGNVAPVTTFSTHLLPIRPDRYRGTDDISSSQLDEVLLSSDGGLRYVCSPLHIVTPEAVLYWENGVFNENILDVKLSRPLTRNLTVNFFSNYRHFDGRTYNHDGNDVYSMYSNITRDTSLLSHSGYNPLTNEHFLGAQASWRLTTGNAHVQFKYGDATNEIILDQDTLIDEPRRALLHRFPMDITSDFSDIKAGNFFIDAEAQYHLEPIIKTVPDTLNNRTIPVRKDARETDLSIALRPRFILFKNDTAGLYTSFSNLIRNPFDLSGKTSRESNSHLFYSAPFQKGILSGTLYLQGGASVFSAKDTTCIAPMGESILELSVKNQTLNLFAQKGVLNLPTSLDNTLLDSASVQDSYYRGGAEVTLQWKKAALLLGYQYLQGISDELISDFWLSGVVPYDQPGSVFIVAPALEWNGLSLHTRFMFADEKPHLKFHGEMSYTTHPLHTQEFIDCILGFDYWGKRDPIEFAGQSDWNNPIYNVSLEVTTQIKSFRFFYKIDNLLNRRFAYVPGYYSPGITFRWGFNWFIQR